MVNMSQISVTDYGTLQQPFLKLLVRTHFKSQTNNFL
jgi:hypothetical protein